MKDVEITTNKNFYNIRYIHFDNLMEFYDYIEKKPVNEFWKGKEQDSETGSYRFTGTHSYDEAKDLFINGIPDEAEKLTKMLMAEKKLQPVSAMTRTNDVAGFQANVPLYLMGVPANMINQKMKPVKKKVLNLYADISYSADWTKEEIREQCIKKFQIISKLESQSYRVNLFMYIGTSTYSKGKRQAVTVIIKLKSANERMNISKLAFPLVHPSMLRRLYFRFLERYENLICYYFGYGRPVDSGIVKDYLQDGYVLPTKITKDVNDIKNLDDLKYL